MQDGTLHFQDEFGRRPKAKSEQEEKVREAKRMGSLVTEALAREDRAKREREESDGVETEPK